MSAKLGHKFLAISLSACLSLCSAASLAADSAFADTLGKNAARASNAPLIKTRTDGGDAVWNGNTALVAADDAFGGVTSNNPAGGTIAHSLPRMIGTYVLKADVRPSNGGSISIGMGSELLAAEFYANAIVSVGVARGGVYEIHTGHGSAVKVGTAKDYGGLNADGSVAIVLTFDSAASRLTVNFNGTDVVKDADVSQSLTAPKFAMAGLRINGTVTPGEPRVRNYSLTAAPVATSGLSIVDATQFFITPNTQSTLSWKAGSIASSQLDYELFDFTGKHTAAGVAKVSDDGMVTADLTLPPGYYDIRFTATNETFGVISLPAVEKRDAFFGMDAALTWLESRQPAREQLVQILARCGIGSVRERLSWGNLPKANDPSAVGWDLGQHPDSMRALYARSGIKVLDSMYGSGARMAYDPKIEYTQKLGLAAQSWRMIVDRWSGNWLGQEIWNEPDVVQVPADQYVPVVKMAAYVRQQAKLDRPVVAGAFTGNAPSTYQDVCAANGMIDSADAISFHTYSSAADLAGLVSQYRHWLAAAGRESLPLYITECGKPWALRDRPTLEDGKAVSAAIASIASEAKAAGIARIFPFIYVSWHLGREHDFGLMAADLTPVRGMAAYANVVRTLTGLNYAGDLPTADNTNSIRVFGDADEQVIVIYTKKILADNTVDLHLPVSRVTGIDGRLLQVGANGEIPVPDGVAFVWAHKAAIAPLLKTDTPMAKLYAIAQQPVAPHAPAAPVVITNVLDRDHTKVSSRRYLISEATAKALPVKVRACNLSDQPQTVTLHLQLPGEQKSAAELVQLTVPPLGETEANWIVDASAAIDVAELRYIKIDGETSDGTKLSPLAIPYVAEGALDVHLARHSYQTPLAIGDLSLWKPNIAASGKMTMKSLDQGGWRLDTTFSATSGRWVYPKFLIKTPIDASKAKGVLIRARVLKPARNIAVMLHESDAPGFWSNEFMPADGEWHVAYIPFGDFVAEPGNPLHQDAILRPEKLTNFQIGMGSDSPDNAMEVSHFLIVGQEAAQ